MQNKFILLILTFFIFHNLVAEDIFSVIPTPYINGINVITGKAEQVNKEYAYEFEGKSPNQKVKRLTSPQVKIEFSYTPNSTEVIENSRKKSIYRYSHGCLITSLEHYLSEGAEWKFYRKEDLYWNTHFSSPSITSRVLINGEGAAILCYTCDYNAQGKICKETLWGDLSGKCRLPLIIDENGYPLKNGIESYSTEYEYALDSELLLKVSEDNGMFTKFFYDADKRCISKIRGNPVRLLSRYFYEYDGQGCLHRTIVDNGQGSSKDDLSGVTTRKIMQMESSQQPASFGQPTLIENKYYNLLTRKEVLLDRTTLTYSSDGKLIDQQLYDGNGQRIQSQEEALDPVKKLSPETGLSPEESYNPIDGWLVTTDAFGNETKCLYDAFGRLIEMQLPSVLDENDQAYQPCLRQKYNICDQTTQVTNALGTTTSTEYNVRGKPILTSYPDGSEESYVYFLDGEVKEKINRNGTRVVVTRDDLCRISSKQEYSSQGVLLHEIFYEYTGELIRSITDGCSFTLTYQYDSAGRQIECRHETLSGIKQATCSYNALGEAINIQTWKGLKDVSFFEKPKEPLEKTPDHLHHSESMICNQLGQFVRFVETVNHEGIKKTETYDALGRLENLRLFNPFGIKIDEQDLRYDAHGRKLQERHHKIIDGKTLSIFIIGWEYDAGDRTVAIHEGIGTSLQKTTSYVFNSYGRLLELIQPNGTKIFYSYNEKDLLEKLRASDDSIAYNYEYDAFHRLIKVDDLLHNTSLYREFDAFNQLIKESDGTASMHFHFDLSGRCTALVLPDESKIKYHYRKQELFSVERLTKDNVPLYQNRYLYDETSGLISECHLIKNLGKIHYQYASGKLVHISSPWWSEQNAASGFDTNGRLVSRIIIDPLGQLNSEYSYEGSQLTLEEGDQSNRYAYDSLYNPVESLNQACRVNEINQLISNSKGHFTYDQNGNLIKKIHDQQVIHYSYDALNRLIRVEAEKKQAKEYRYDAFNRRIQEQSFLWSEKDAQWLPKATYKYLYDGEREIGKINQLNEISELRVLGLGKGAEIGAAIALELEGEIYAPIHDTQGSVRCLIDQEGQVAEFYRYQAFGEEEIFDQLNRPTPVSQIKNPWRYFSKRVDDFSNLIFFGLRNYDPDMGRWTTPDPLFFGDTPNVYAFVKNDPLNNYDLHGLFTVSSIWNWAKENISYYYQSIKRHTIQIREFVNDQLRLPPSLRESLDQVGKSFIGDYTILLFGYHNYESHSDYYGERELSDKVRITFVNGMLTNHNMLQENLDLISKSHGGVKVHYVFRASKGWSNDLWKAALIKTCYYFGYRSGHAYLLAETWREMIKEMGGINGGGVIIHYAHSLGGSITDRARTLLTPDEQKMIRVFTIGSATLINNEGFQNVINIISPNDFIFEPISRIKNYYNSNLNVRVYGSFSLNPFGLVLMWPFDHSLNGFTYKPILCQLGQNFLDEFDT